MEVTELLPKIPDEVFIMEIQAKRVDVKTLGACACVSKWWNKTLHSHEFKDTHHRHHGQSMQPLFLDFEIENQPDVQHRCLRISTGNQDDIGKFSKCHGVYFLDSFWLCHDLVFIKHYHNIGLFRVCNPWTDQTLELPPIPETLDLNRTVVFGYLASLGKYVVVSICKTRLRLRVNKLSFDLVNYDSSSEWKWVTIKDECPRNVDRGIYVDNFVYCHIVDFRPENSNELLVSLDLEKEEFRIIKCPQTPFWESRHHLQSVCITLLDLNGTLGLTDTDTMCGTDQVFKLWALKRELGQWEMMYNVKLDHLGMELSRRPLEYSPKSFMEGELILLSEHDGIWYIYNPKINAFRTIT